MKPAEVLPVVCKKAWVPWTYMKIEHKQPEEFKPFLRIDCVVVFRYHQLFMNHLVPWYRVTLSLKFFFFFSQSHLQSSYKWPLSKKNRGQKWNYLIQEMVLIKVLVEFELLKPCADIDSWGKFHTWWVIFTNCDHFAFTWLSIWENTSIVTIWISVHFNTSNYAPMWF